MIVFCGISLFFLCSRSHAQETGSTYPLYAQVQRQVLLPFFDALRKGDIDAIKDYITEDMFGRNKVLLEQNKEYPKFLRGFYRGAKFHIKRVSLGKNKIICDVEVELANGSVSTSRLDLVLSSQVSDARYGYDSWKIANLSGKSNYGTRSPRIDRE